MAIIRRYSFTVGGTKVALNRRDVELSLEGASPETLKKYSVHVGGRDYPIKQALSAATGIPNAEFISTDAYRILTRLGFVVKKWSKAQPEAASKPETRLPLSRAGRRLSAATAAERATTAVKVSTNLIERLHEYQKQTGTSTEACVEEALSFFLETTAPARLYTISRG